VVRKGTDQGIDSYSGFFDNGHRRSTGLSEYLRQQKIEQVAILGLATDYCVRFTALDAVKQGFRTLLIEDGCRGVELHPGDIARAMTEMKRAGVELVQSEEFLA
jgi:nicotinamidase/pyrazinamidase